MVFNTTYKNNEDEEIINDLVGKPYSLIKAIRLGGVGSGRMMVEDTSPNMHGLLNVVSDINYANIELRPGGILIRINKGLQNFTWAIPYYQLVLYQGSGSSIHAAGRYIRFMKNKLFRENKKFFKKLLDLKIKYDTEFSSPTMSM